MKKSISLYLALAVVVLMGATSMADTAQLSEPRLRESPAKQSLGKRESPSHQSLGKRESPTRRTKGQTSVSAPQNQ